MNRRTQLLEVLGRRSRSWPAVLVLALVACSFGAARSEAVSTSTTTVTGTLLSSTSLTTSGCSGAALSMGPIQVSSTSITATDCTIGFGSSNDTSRFRIWQADQSGSALTQFASTFNSLQGAPNYYGAAAKSATEGWLVGAAFKAGQPIPIVRTTDSGATWSAQTSCHATLGLSDIEFVTSSTLVAVGTSGLICRTTDSGATWTQMTPPAGSNTWSGVTSFAGTKIWAAGLLGKVVTSSDGITWASLPSLPATWTIRSLDAASATNLYGTATDAGTSPTSIYGIASTDGGTTWTTRLIGNTIVGGGANAIVALSPTSAIMSSSYGSYRTVDSGNSWQQVDTARSYCITAFSASTIVSYFSAGTPPRRSTDGGTTWANVALPSSGSGVIYGCETGSSTGGFYGGINDQRGATADAGVTHVTSPTPFYDQRGVAAWSSSRFVTVGDGGSIRRSIDSGVTITIPASGTTQDLADVESIGTSVAVAVGSGGTILRSTDQAATWTPVASGTALTLRAIDGGPDGWAYVVGYGGVVRRSSDDGASWTTIPSPSAANLLDVVALGRDEAWAVGAGGVIYRTSNAGTTWTSQVSGTALDLLSIDSVDGMNALATSTTDGSNRTLLLRTTDGGATWSSTLTAPNISSFTVRYLDATTAVIGEGSGYRRSTDGGVSWTSYPSTAGGARAIAPLDANSFVVASLYDVIARVAPTDSMPDYALGSNDFAGSTGAFGACLHGAIGTASTSWPVAGVGNCGSANLTNWRGITNDSTLAAATIATTSASGNATLSLRFGAKPSATQKPGLYTAKLQLEVLAP